MTFYLPVAEMSANILIFLAMSAAVGFLSGLFGVGGGFLMTPLLIFSGVPRPWRSAPSRRRSSPLPYRERLPSGSAETSIF